MTKTTNGKKEIVSIDNFWEEWLKVNDDLLGKCLYFTNNSLHDAEELLSEAMLKALLSFIEQRTEVRNFKSWLSLLTSLTKNF